MTILGRTWNQNPAGRLWERVWYEDEQGYASQLVASGVFIPPARYESKSQMKAQFDQDAHEFFGEWLTDKADGK